MSAEKIAKKLALEFSKRVAAEGEWLGIEQVRTLCPRCADVMAKKGMKSIRASLILKARDSEISRRVAYGWSGLPKGWTKDTAAKYFTSMGGSVSTCIDKMEKHMGAGAGGFCAGLADMVKGTAWRHEPRKKKTT